VPYSPNGEGTLRETFDGSIDGRARETSNTGDDGYTSSSQLLGVERSDQMLLSFIQMRMRVVKVIDAARITIIDGISSIGRGL
jgi:hypothetical protein